MILVFGGAEVASNRLLLESMKVNHVGFSFWRAHKRGLPKNKIYYLSDHFDSDVSIYVDWNNAKYEDLSANDRDAYDAAYQDFLLNNADRITMSMDHHAGYVGQKIVEWNGKGKPPKNAVVGIPHSVVESDTSLSAKIRMSKRDGTQFMALGTARPDNLRAIPFDFATSLAWLSPMRRGETIIWDGTRLVRYPSSMKDQARRRYKAQVDKSGLSFEKFLADNNKEVAKVTIWSFLQLQDDLQRKSVPAMVATNSDFEDKDDIEQNPMDDADNSPVLMNNKSVAHPARKGGAVNLPGLAFGVKTITETSITGERTETEVPIAELSGEPLRQCDTCFVAVTCPAFVAGNSCAFKIPVELRTKEQLRSLMSALLEMQAQRVFFARFAEEQNGGYPDPNLSMEMDRLFRLTKNMKDIESDQVQMKMTVEASGGSGLLASIFGKQLEQKQLPAPIPETDVSRYMADVLEAEVLDDAE